MTKSKTYIDMVNQYKDMHENGMMIDNGNHKWKLPARDCFDGSSVEEHFENIKKIIKDEGFKTLLDYGCGKAKHHTDNRLRDYWGLESVKLFDPAIKKFEIPPIEKSDMVICVDVLEHIKEEDIPMVLKHIDSLAKEHMYLVISITSAYAFLPNGDNAHCTIKTMEWWTNIIKENIKTPVTLITQE